MSQNVVGKSNKIRHIVKLRHMVQQWRKKAATQNTTKNVPSDVPEGHVAICVGSECRRFIVRATYLNHPIFRKLLIEAEEEYGFVNQGGPLYIPCDESVFEEMLESIRRAGSVNLGRCIGVDELHRCRHVSFANNRDVIGEARSLLRG